MMTLLFFAVLMYFVPVGIHGTVTLTTTGDPLTGSTISIVCHIPTFTSASGTAGWINPSISSLAFHSCIRAFCVPSVATYPRYTFSVTDTNFTITIINATLDDDDWTCEYDTPAGSDSTVLGMKVAPTSCTLTQTGSVYTCSTSCGYPQNDIYIQAKLNGTSNPENLVITTVSSPVCTSPESAFSATVPPEFYQQGGHLYCECGVTNYQSTVIQSDQVYVPANPDPNPDCPCTGETVLLSLSIAIMCMVLMHAWLVFLFTKGIIKWNIPTVSKCDNEKSPVNIIVVTIAISLCCVVGMVLCAVGMSICQKCTSSDDNTGLILAIVGFVLVVVGLVVDILYVCIFQKKTGHGEVAQVNKGELDENKTNATDDEKDGLLKDGQTSKAEEPSGKEDEQNVKKDEQNTKEDEQNRKGEEEKEKTDKTEEQNGKDDEQVEKKIEQDGEKVDETGKKDDQSGKKDEQPGKNEHNIIRASPKEKETHKDGDPV